MAASRSEFIRSAQTRSSQIRMRCKQRVRLLGQVRRCKVGSLKESYSMRRISVSLVTLGFILVVLGSSFLRSNAKTDATVLPQSRCTRLTYPPKKKSKTADQTTFGSRCTRLAGRGKPGTVLPNTAPKV